MCVSTSTYSSPPGPFCWWGCRIQPWPENFSALLKTHGFLAVHVSPHVFNLTFRVALSVFLDVSSSDEAGVVPVFLHPPFGWEGIEISSKCDWNSRGHSGAHRAILGDSDPFLTLSFHPTRQLREQARGPPVLCPRSTEGMRLQQTAPRIKAWKGRDLLLRED